jgi:type IV secretory pathway VirB2 component (pilin)
MNRETRLSAVTFGALVMLASATGPADAADIAGVLNNLISFINSATIKAIATIMIMVIGIGWMFGHIDLRKAGMLVIGIGVVTSASQIAGTLTGG